MTRFSHKPATHGKNESSKKIKIKTHGKIKTFFYIILVFFSFTFPRRVVLIIHGEGGDGWSVALSVC